LRVVTDIAHANLKHLFMLPLKLMETLDRIKGQEGADKG